jgi:putative flippase GtrA
MKLFKSAYIKTAAAMEQLTRFALVGALGFLLDSGVLYIGLYFLGLGYYLGRLVSYLCASTVTWYFHRVYTFKLKSLANKKKQFLSFVLLNSLGGVVNYSIYALLVANYEIYREIPVVAVAIGALFGMFVNYYLSKKIVFTS